MSNKKLEFSMKVDIPTVMLLIAMATSFFIYIKDIEQDVALNTQTGANNHALIIEMKKDREALVDMLLARFDRADDKMDRMIEIIHSYQVNK